MWRKYIASKLKLFLNCVSSTQCNLGILPAWCMHLDSVFGYIFHRAVTECNEICNNTIICTSPALVPNNSTAPNTITATKMSWTKSGRSFALQAPLTQLKQNTPNHAPTVVYKFYDENIQVGTQPVAKNSQNCVTGRILIILENLAWVHGQLNRNLVK